LNGDDALLLVLALGGSFLVGKWVQRSGAREPTAPTGIAVPQSQHVDEKQREALQKAARSDALVTQYLAVLERKAGVDEGMLRPQRLLPASREEIGNALLFDLGLALVRGDDRDETVGLFRECFASLATFVWDDAAERSAAKGRLDAQAAASVRDWERLRIIAHEMASDSYRQACEDEKLWMSEAAKLRAFFDQHLAGLERGISEAQLK